MPANSIHNPSAGTNRRDFVIILVCLVVVLSVLFHKSFLPGQVVFSNDGPLGALNSQPEQALNNLKGMWQPLNWLGTAQPSATPSLVNTMLWLFGPLVHAKILPPTCLLILGLCAWFYFRQLGFSNAVCVIGSIAATLNMNYFSNACWGQISRPLALSAVFLALTALQSPTHKHRWAKTLLAGMALGFGIMESFDIGAIFSLVIASFMMFQALIGDGSVAKKWIQGVVRVALVAIFAALVSAQTLDALVSTQIRGVVGTKQDEESKARRWDESTQWSFPKIETLQMIVPGVFGYRMDTGGGGNYWGSQGQDAAWERYFDSGRQGPPPNGGMLRFSGGGTYAGLLVLVLALWAVRQSFRKQNSPFTVSEQKYIWFWSVVAIVSLLLAFGRYAPFYQLFYALPYASTIRAPGKFVLTFDWALLIVFAYGLQGFSRLYLEKAGLVGKGVSLKSWWAKAMAADSKWITGSVIAMAASLLAWLIYASSRTGLEDYLVELERIEAAARGGAIDPGAARAAAHLQAGFSLGQVGWYVLFLGLTLGLMAWIMSGRFAGARAKWGSILLGLLLTVDLTRANLPWIVYWNVDEKYVQAGNNPVIDFLKRRPYEHRVALLPFPAPPQFSLLQYVYEIEWKQHLFQYYRIQSLDIVQMPRSPEDRIQFESALMSKGTMDTLFLFARRWQLTDTRFLLGPMVTRLPWGDSETLKFLNDHLDSTQKRFKVHTTFEFYRTTENGPFLARTNSTGPYALFEFTGALPRAKLYANLQVSTNDEATLKQLASSTFDPAQTVLVANDLPIKASSTVTNQNVGTVEFVSYSPKQIVLRARAEVPSVLLLNDHFDPKWKVQVDSRPADLLRCNYLMRGVQLPAGEHSIEFSFSSGERSLQISLASILAGLALLAFVLVTRKRQAA